MKYLDKNKGIVRKDSKIYPYTIMITKDDDSRVKELIGRLKEYNNTIQKEDQLSWHEFGRHKLKEQMDEVERFLEDSGF
jgi:exonuclease I